MTRRCWVASSTCPDEICCAKAWEPLFDNGVLPAFRLGGLAGLPFAGATGFRAYASHAPDGGGLFVFYGPHVGVSSDGARIGAVAREGQAMESGACGACVGALAWARQQTCQPCVRPADEPGDYQMACVKQAVVRHLPAIDAAEGKDEVAVLCDKLCDDIRAGLLEAIDKACPGQPAYLLGGIQINGPTEGPELLAIRHFELRAPDGTLTDKMAALERALDLQVNGFN